MYDGRDPGSDRRSEPFADADDPVVGAVALAVLGAGLGSLFGVPVLDAIEFWVIFAIGYAVVVPLVSLFRGRSAESARDRPRESRRDGSEGADADADADADDALDRLRDRYARGELSEAQFERKLETLLETETPEDARERIDRAAEPDGRDGDAEPEFERSE